MGIFKKLIQGFIAPLSAEEAARIRNAVAEFDFEVSMLMGRYTSPLEEDALKIRLETAYRRVKAIRIPMQHELYQRVLQYFDDYRRLHEIIAENNAIFMNLEKNRCDALLSNVDGKSLDDQQRNAVVSDAERNLVLAGAGSGKTLTIAGKVRYLCSEKQISPDEILLIAFTKKAAEEMTERISGRLGIPVQATTFHKLGLDIVTAATGTRPDVQDELSDFVTRYFEEHIFEDPTAVHALLEFFAYYLSVPANAEKFGSLGEVYEYERSADFETLRSKYERTKFLEDTTAERKEAKKTLRGEQVKSLEEVMIANFLFLHGVEYEYERLYPFQAENKAYKRYRPDFYLPKYDLYLEHFGVSKDGRAPWLSSVEEKKYLEGIQWKREFHRQNETTLLETYSYYVGEGNLLQKLEQKLKQHNVEMKPKDFSEIFRSVYIRAGDKYFASFIRLCCAFITLFKSNAYTVSQLHQLQSRSPRFQSLFYVQRTDLFKNIVGPIICAYNAYLEENGALDFSDMINQATSHVLQGHEVSKYKWIIVDEFQDTSIAQYRLLKAILDQTKAKLLCVGDDWQSIYRFAGSDLSIFTKFKRYFGSAEILKIERTYRNSQRLIDEAGRFVMQNPAQMRKRLKSDKNLDYPITFMGYSTDPFAVLKKSIDKIIDGFGSNSSIMLLGRTNYDFEMLRASDLFTVGQGGCLSYKSSPQTPVSFFTVHKAKGLEADNVVLLNFQSGKLGFPNKIADDPVLELVLTEEDPYPFAEERRLLYVALTRTRNRVFILVNEVWPSEFYNEFKESKAVFALSNRKKEIENAVSCPRCKTGTLMARKNEGENSYFLGCTNYPQCDYTVNEMEILREPKVCPECGGFLVKRKGKFGHFYGCTNYPLCKHTEQIENS